MTVTVDDGKPIANYEEPPPPPDETAGPGGGVLRAVRPRHNLPVDLDAEEWVLGCMLGRPADAIPQAAGLLERQSFFDVRNGELFDVLVNLNVAGEVDTGTVVHQLRKLGTLEPFGGAARVADLINRPPSYASVGRYARIVAEAAAARALMRLAADVSERAQAWDIVGARSKLAEAGDLAETPSDKKFRAVDLGLLMDEGQEPLALVHRWLYAGRLTMLGGEPGVGKTLFALDVCRQVMEEGHNVVYMDEENGPIIIKNRLLALGVTRDMVDRHFRYYPFESRAWNVVDLAAFGEMLGDNRAALVVFDSLPDFLVAAGLDEDRSTDITGFVARVFGKCRAAGAAQLVLDHFPKPETGKGGKKAQKYLRGSGAKKGKADAQLTLTQIVSFDAEHSGKWGLWKSKDRAGQLPLPDVDRAEDAMVLDVRVTGHGTGLRVVELEGAVAKSAVYTGPTLCMEAVLALLRSAPGVEYTKNGLRSAMRLAGHPFRDATIMEAAERLAADGRVSHRAGQRGAFLVSWQPGDQAVAAPFDVDSPDGDEDEEEPY